MPDPTPLSPTTQEVLDAYHAAPIVGIYPQDADQLGVAAAIRAVVKVTAKRKVMKTFGITMAQSVPYCLESDILAIASELEGLGR